MTNLIDPPSVYVLPVSWHGDRPVTFENVDADDAELTPPVWTPVDYEDGVVAYLDLKTEPPQRFPATITGNKAYVKIESEICDTLENRTLWAFILSYPESPTTEVVAVNGTITRFDGKAS